MENIIQLRLRIHSHSGCKQIYVISCILMADRPEIRGRERVACCCHLRWLFLQYMTTDRRCMPQYYRIFRNYWTLNAEIPTLERV